MNMARALIVGTIVFACITLGFIVFQLREWAAYTTLNANLGNTGNEFLVQGRKVDVNLTTPPTRLPVGEPITAVLSFQPPSNPDISGLGNEHDGTFNPSLSMSDCTVNPQQQPPQPSTQPIAAFTWTWTVSDCSQGDKLLRATLGFAGPSDSDAEPYRFSQYVKVVQPLTFLYLLPLIPAIAGAITAVLTTILTFNQVLSLRRPSE